MTVLKNNQGFSLVELMVVVTILVVFSGTTLVGFQYFGQNLRAKEVVGLVEDALQHAEMSILREEYETVRFHFFEDYLVMEEHPIDAFLPFTLGGECTHEGVNGHLVQSLVPQPTTLTQKDEAERVLNVHSLDAYPGFNSKYCAPFSGSEEAEWRYQLSSEESLSPFIVFSHFNRNRDELSTHFSLEGPNNVMLELKTPYAKRMLFVNHQLSPTAISFTVEKDGQSTSNTLTIP